MHSVCVCVSISMPRAIFENYLYRNLVVVYRNSHETGRPLMFIS